MLGMSAAVLQGLHEMRRPPEEIKIVRLTEIEFRRGAELKGMSPFDTDIAIKMMKAGALFDAGGGWRVELVAEAPEASTEAE